jgi:ABC-2 type transport system permease protein
MRRLLRLWRLYGYLDVAWMLRDLGQFVSYAVSDVITVMGAITAMLLLAERFQGIGPWTREMVVFLLGYAVMVNGVLDTLFGYNVVYISRRIGRGQLDHILVQPQPMWLTLLTEGFSPCAGLPIFLTGLGLFLWGGWASGIAVTPQWLLLFALNFAGSCAIVFWFTYAVGSLAFWAPRAAEEINSSTWKLFGQLRTFPLDGVAPLMLTGLMTAVPVGFVTWYPSRSLLGLEEAPLAAFVTPLAAVAFSAAGLAIFRHGLGHYVRSGSQRYLDYGHRR